MLLAVTDALNVIGGLETGDNGNASEADTVTPKIIGAVVLVLMVAVIVVYTVITRKRRGEK